MFSEKIRIIAESYIGKEEIRGNRGFIDRKMQADMEARGWQKGQAWCAYFAEMVWAQAYMGQAAQLKIIENLFSGMAIVTFKQFAQHESALKQMKKTPFFKTSQTPTVGAVVIWKLGNGPSGHAGIVVKVNPNGTFETVEGNTNDDGSREGYEVARKTRHLVEGFGPKKLNLVGFILPWEPGP